MPSLFASLPDLTAAPPPSPQAAPPKPPYFDKFGREITVGSYIAYGHGLAYGAGLRIGKVLHIGTRISGFNSKENLAITVWGIEDEFAPRPEKNPDHWTRPVELCKSRGILKFPERILVLEPSSLPALYRELLEPITMDTRLGGTILPVSSDKAHNR